jgi:hypothetical protein
MLSLVLGQSGCAPRESRRGERGFEVFRTSNPELRIAPFGHVPRFPLFSQ